MKQVTFDNCFGTLNLLDKVQSIFDPNIAGQIATDGQYYIIHLNKETKQHYAVTKDVERCFERLGRPLAEGETAIFVGEKVRCMTREEEELYNMDSLDAYVDYWGNVKAD